MTHNFDLAKKLTNAPTSIIKPVGLIYIFKFAYMATQVVPICLYILGKKIPDMYGGTP